MVIGHTDCEGPMGVIVRRDDAPDIRYPIIDRGASLHERRQGPTSITRFCRATFPISGFGRDDWLAPINYTDGGELRVADVVARRLDGDGRPVGPEAPIFRGYIKGVGSVEGDNRASMVIIGPHKLLGRISAGVRFTDARVSDVLSYVRDRFINEQPIFDSLKLGGSALGRSAVRDDALEQSGVARTGEPVDVPEGNTRAKVFSANRDSLAHVVRWLKKVADVRVFFSVDDDQLTLVAADDPAARYDGTEGGDLAVISNDALYENPSETTIRLNGKARTALDVGDQDGEAFDTRYPQAEATYEPLRRRAGGKIVETDTSQATDVDSLEREAKARLLERLSLYGGGDIKTVFAPHVRPFDVLKAVPTCASVTAATVDPPLNFGVLQAIHRVRPADDALPRSILGVGIEVDPSKITVESSIRSAKTGKAPEGERAVDQYSWLAQGGS